MSIEASVPSPGKWTRYRIAIVALGMVALAVSLVGIWYSLPPADTPADVDAITPANGNAVLTAHKKPLPVANVRFEDGNGTKRALADFKGKVVLLNIWATWCSPCRKEMPTLDRLQAKLGSKDFEVVALSIDRDGQAVVKSFYGEIAIRALAVYVDATTEAQSKLGVIGVPTTLLIDPQGREIARHIGVAEWDRPEVVDVVKRYLPHPKAGGGT